jgi:hypothetical protein
MSACKTGGAGVITDPRIETPSFEPHPDRCHHGKTWAQECPDSAAVWRQERIADLRVMAAKYGFKLVPLGDERLSPGEP